MNLSGVEILVILLVALIVLGPQRLPDAAKQVGKAMGELRRLSTGFQNEMRRAMDEAGTDDTRSRTATQDVRGKEQAAPSSNGSDAGGGAGARGANDAGSGHPTANGGHPARPRRTQPLRAAPDPESPGSDERPRAQ